jgi:hypothetical protein
VFWMEGPDVPVVQFVNRLGLKSCTCDGHTSTKVIEKRVADDDIEGQGIAQHASECKE